MTPRELGYQVGQVAAPILLIGIAVYIGVRMGRKRQPPGFVAWPAAIAVLLVVAALAVKLQKKQAEPTPASETR